MSKAAQTVLGPVVAEKLGSTLVHEHMVFDFLPSCLQDPETPEEGTYVDREVSAEILGFLRFHPLLVKDNLRNRDEDLVIDEIGYAIRQGTRTMVDPTNVSIGRDPEALARIAAGARIQIVMGAGFYTEWALEKDERFQRLGVEDIAAEIIQDVQIGAGGTAIRAGIIGEIGTSWPITPAEEKSLRGSAIAQAETGAPLQVHLNGWGREGNRVLDIVIEEGANPEKTILCHMNPSWYDEAYQAGLIERGAYVEYDMFGNNHVYPEPMGPSPDEMVCLTAIGKHLRAGRGDRILLSQDVYLKMMFRRFGGYGYAHILENLTRLFGRAQITPEDLEMMLVQNPSRALSFLEMEDAAVAAG